MAAGKKIIYAKNARDIILSGIHDVERTVALTFGPQGRTVAFDKGGNFKITKDGISVANEIKFTDEVKNFGAMLVKEAASKSNYQSGDGSSSTTILTAGLCDAAHRLLNQGIDINELREGFKIARAYVLEQLLGYLHSIEDNMDLYNIAYISSNSDVEIASAITNAFSQIGDNGIVTLADSMSRSGQSEVKFSTGIEFDRGFLHGQSVNSANDQAVFESPAIMLSSQVLNDPNLLATILQPVLLNKIPIVIIAPDFDDEVLAWFREQLAKKTVSGALVLAPGVSRESVNNNLVDYSVLLNCKIAYQDVDITDYNIIENVGECERIVITKGKTVIVGPKTSPERFEQHIENLQAKVNSNAIDFAYSEFEIELIKERIARMSGGIATIFVGALTAPELSEKKDRYEDAVNAVRSTLQDGYVPGAGTPLLRISYEGPKGKASIGVCTAIGEYLKALRKPAKLLITSAGADPEAVVPAILKNKANGFDAKEGKVVDLLKEGIIDPYKVIVNSVVYATNVAEAFMGVDAVITTDVPNMGIQPLDDVLQESGVLR
jgi:chaperonin GroEL